MSNATNPQLYEVNAVEHTLNVLNYAGNIASTSYDRNILEKLNHETITKGFNSAIRRMRNGVNTIDLTQTSSGTYIDFENKSIYSVQSFNDDTPPYFSMNLYEELLVIPTHLVLGIGINRIQESCLMPMANDYSTPNLTSLSIQILEFATKVHAKMKELGWSWARDGIPTVARIIETMHSLVDSLIHDRSTKELHELPFYSYNSTGGLTVRHNNNMLLITFGAFNYDSFDFVD